MPVITVTMGQGQTSKQQKKQLIESITTHAMDIMNLPAQSFTILINELNADSIGVGGITLKNLLEKQKE